MTLRLRFFRQAVLLVVVTACLVFAARAVGNDTDSYEKRRAQALELNDRHSPDAEKALKALLKENPKDSIVKIKYAYCLFYRAQGMPEGRKRKALIKEARSYIVQAKDSRVEQPLIDLILNATNEDGSEAKARFSQSNRADDLIKQAEKAYSAHDFAKARDFYQQALQSEPTNYPATLFIGDAYFTEGKLPESIEWFTKAAALNPNIETAFRYWGDALAKLGRNDEALERYLEAVVADPYNKMPRHTLTVFAQHRGLAVRFQASPLPDAGVKVGKEKVELAIGENAGVLTMSYAIFRAGWINEHKMAESKNAPKYRQTLAEEKATLELLRITFFEMKEGQTEVDREIALYATAFKELQQICDAGMLEPHILFTRATPDIAQDYAAYRAEHRDLLITYLKRFYLGQQPGH